MSMFSPFPSLYLSPLSLYPFPLSLSISFPSLFLSPLSLYLFPLSFSIPFPSLSLALSTVRALNNVCVCVCYNRDIM